MRRIVVTPQNKAIILTDKALCLEDAVQTVTIQQLIALGMAETVSGSGGTYIRILPNCIYKQNEISNLVAVAFNTEKIDAGKNNTLIWDTHLPAGWSSRGVASIYDGNTMGFTPRANMFWALTGLDSLEITFAGGSWNVNDYPWGSGTANGIFAPRFNASKESEYNELGFRNTPDELIVSINATYSSVAQTMFTGLRGTTSLTLNVSGDFAVHDATGMFEADTELTTLNIVGRFLWSTIRLCHNMFDGCSNLTAIPKISTNARTHAYNILYPRYDGTRGSANCVKAFDCPKLEYLGPILNMNAISLNGCTAGGYSQGALGSGNLFDCPLLTDVLIQNLNNNDWNFADTSTKTRIPSMNVESIEYLLEHVADCAANPHTVTFSTLHQGEISQSSIASANAKGWTVAYQTLT